MAEDLELVKEEVKKLPKGTCYVCSEKIKDHSDNDLLECLVKFVDIPADYQPLKSVGDAIRLTIGKVNGTIRISHDQDTFVMQFGNKVIKTKTPARDIVKYLVETYKGDQSS